MSLDKNIRIVFMGTPKFAVATLESLITNGFNVVGVVTTPDKPAGRGRKLQKSAVKEFAESNCIPILQPDNLKDPEFLNSLKSFNGNVFIIVAFRMLPEEVWKMPDMGTINLHASLLPQYRGAAPINHAIINGETQTGVTTFFIDDKIDTGNILLKEEVDIYAYDNADDLHNILSETGAQLMIKTLLGIADNSIKPKAQSLFITDVSKLKTAPKIFPKDCIIDWNQEVTHIHNFIRGLSSSPGARSSLKNNEVTLSFKILECFPEYAEHNLLPGTISTDGKHYLKIAGKDGFINIIDLQVEGRKKMNVTEFLNGFGISGYTINFN